MHQQTTVIEARGKAAHAGLAPDEGISAILECAYLLEWLLGRPDSDALQVQAISGGMRANVIAPRCQVSISSGTAQLAALQQALQTRDPALPGTIVALVAADGSKQSAAAPDGQYVTAGPDLSLKLIADLPARRRSWRAVAPAGALQAVAALPRDELAGRVLDWLRSRSDAMTGLLRALVELETPSSDPASQMPAFELLAQELAGIGYSSCWRAGQRTGGFLLAQPVQRRRAAPLQLLLGHCDTVWPVGTLATMPVTVDAGRLSGPGAFDMKAGLVQGIFALRALHALGMQPDATPLFLINSDEEIGSPESARVIQWLAQVSCRAFVLEPALGLSGKLKTARKGVGQFRVVLRGDGDRHLALEWARLCRVLFGFNDRARGVSVNVGVVRGTPANGLLAEVEMAVDVRVPDGEAARAVETAINGLTSQVSGIELLISGQVSRLPLEPTPRNQSLWRTGQTLGAALGLILEEGAAGGASDGNITSQYCATLDGLGAVGDGAHAVHEFVELAHMPERAALLALLLLSPPPVAGSG